MQIADITVKKADGATNVVYTAITASAGDRSPALWRSNTSATLRGNRTTISMEAHSNGPGTARRVTVKFSAPVVRTIESQEVVVGTVPLEFSGVIPNGLTDSEITEAVEQAVNLLASTLIRQSIAIAYAPV